MSDNKKDELPNPFALMMVVSEALIDAGVAPEDIPKTVANTLGTMALISAEDNNPAYNESHLENLVLSNSASLTTDKNPEGVSTLITVKVGLTSHINNELARMHNTHPDLGKEDAALQSNLH